ncbi:hypothetical protein NDU88_004203 [Pleurodeles waltl]|uniref:Uncharacterized protein n=1 Tax=Pleurodeles waltl TaxID=8319 RepID=A0AAV7SI33_PLEWA|nr:hypothetical protein NDU88_004203 [Pleurodeles waltl]
MKVVLCGHCIRTVVGARATLHKGLTEIEASLKNLEPSASTQAVLNTALATHAQTVEQLLCINFKAYQAKMQADGDKADCLLAWLLPSAYPPNPS